MFSLTKLSTSLLISSVLAFGCAAETDDAVGPDGGTITSRDGRLVIHIPKGALDETVDFTIGEVEDCTSQSRICYELEPSPVMLAIPAQIVYFYDADEMVDADMDRVRFLALRGEDWEKLPDRQIDEDSQTVSGSALYLSAFALVETP